MSGRARILIAVVVSAGLIGGCTTAGHPGETVVDLAALDAGAYDTRPLAVPAAQDGKYGKLLESVRMGEAIIDPALADPDAKYSLGVGIAELPTPDIAALRLGDSARSVVDAQRMLAGFWVGGTDAAGSGGQVGGAHRLSLVLLRFPDEATAARAAEGIDRADVAVNPENVAVTVPGYAAARAHWRPGVPSLSATVAHGVFVVSVVTELPDAEVTALSGVAAKAFATQLPALDRFTPTPVGGLASLSLDTDGMLRRALPPRHGEWTYPAQSSATETGVAGWQNAIVDSGIVYGPNVIRLKYVRGTPGDSHAGASPLSAADAFAKVQFRGVMRFPDPTAARKYLVQPQDASKRRQIAPPAGVDGRCYQDLTITPDPATEQGFACFVMYHRYVAFVSSGDQQDVLRRAAAQYELLVTAER